MCPMYISEIADVSIRGTLGSFFQLFLTIGILFVYAVGAHVKWTVLSMLCAVFPVLLVIFMLIVPDSPTYFLKQVNIFLSINVNMSVFDCDLIVIIQGRNS